MIIWSLLESGGGTERQEKKEGKTIEDATPVNKHLKNKLHGVVVSYEIPRRQLL